MGERGQVRGRQPRRSFPKGLPRELASARTTQVQARGSRSDGETDLTALGVEDGCVCGGTAASAVLDGVAFDPSSPAFLQK